MTDELKAAVDHLQDRVDSWAGNTDRAWLSVKLGPLRAVLRFLSSRHPDQPQAAMKAAFAELQTAKQLAISSGFWTNEAGYITDAALWIERAQSTLRQALSPEQFAENAKCPPSPELVAEHANKWTAEEGVLACSEDELGSQDQGSLRREDVSSAKTHLAETFVERMARTPAPGASAQEWDGDEGREGRRGEEG